MTALSVPGMALAAEDEATRITVVLADGSTEEREAAYASLESTVRAAASRKLLGPFPGRPHALPARPNLADGTALPTIP